MRAAAQILTFALAALLGYGLPVAATSCVSAATACKVETPDCGNCCGSADCQCCYSAPAAPSTLPQPATPVSVPDHGKTHLVAPAETALAPAVSAAGASSHIGSSGPPVAVPLYVRTHAFLI
jgi:hypothetical protein